MGSAAPSSIAIAVVIVIAIVSIPLGLNPATMHVSTHTVVMRCVAAGIALDS
jgi:ABC-type microcin C transport system permease subunit YejB